MPIYEFKCSKCQHFFELLVMGSDDRTEIACPQCHSREFERVLSTSHFAVGSGSGGKQGATRQTRACSSGSCTTYTIPGPNG